MKLLSWLPSVWSWIVRNRRIIIVGAAAVLILLFGALWVYRNWGWLAMVTPSMESGSTTIRNIGLMIGGLFAVGFAIWRGVVANRQAKASQHQAEISQRGLLNERYQKGAEMLGSAVLSVRLGGIYALQHLAEDVPEQYHVQIMRLLCAFVRHSTGDKDRDDNARPTGTEREPNIKDYQVREDVQAAMTAIGDRSDGDIGLEKKEKFSPDLSGAYLPFVYLFEANLTDVVLIDAKFYPANLTVQEQDKSKNTFLFACAYLVGANLSNAFLTGADLTRAHLSGANLTGTNLTGAKGLIQEQLNQACADPGNPPNLSNLRDAEADVLLEWRGKSLEDP